MLNSSGAFRVIVRVLGYSAFSLGLLLLLPQAAQAQLHGASIGKACQGPKKICAVNGDCPDAASCTGVGICSSTLAERTTDCIFQVTNVDQFSDTLRILAAEDVVKPTLPGETTVPVTITAVSGTTTCTVGGTLPCDLSPGASVTFRSNSYVIQTGDPDPLPDQGRVQFQDLCNAPGTSGCSGEVNTLQGPASTDLITGCGPGPTCTPNPTVTSTPTNTPTNPPTATFTPVEGPPPPTVPTLSFPMMAMLGLLLAGAGLFLSRRS